MEPLAVSDFRLELARRGCRFTAATVWNSQPIDIKSISSTSFSAVLKTVCSTPPAFTRLECGASESSNALAP